MKRKRTMGTLTPVHHQRHYVEQDHQIEKLEFALAVAVGSGDQARIQELRSKIAALGDNGEEPGT
jgi:hypothetical protein